MKTDMTLFEEYQIRRIYDEDAEIWWFSVIDIIEVLTGTARPRRYWNDLKKKLINEGYNKVSENIGHL